MSGGNMLSVEEFLVEAISVRKESKKTVTDWYAYALVSGEPVNWSNVNYHIVRRWSAGTLKRIKFGAFRLKADPQFQSLHARQKGEA